MLAAACPCQPSHVEARAFQGQRGRDECLDANHDRANFQEVGQPNSAAKRLAHSQGIEAKACGGLVGLHPISAAYYIG